MRPDRAVLLISSTSWSPDEDFMLLLRALQNLDRSLIKRRLEGDVFSVSVSVPLLSASLCLCLYLYLSISACLSASLCLSLLSLSHSLSVCLSLTITLTEPISLHFFLRSISIPHSYHHRHNWKRSPKTIFYGPLVNDSELSL
jgi:hypothetical protein